MPRTALLAALLLAAPALRAEEEGPAVYVRFTFDRRAEDPDHSKAVPGPDESRADRAGYSSLRLKKQLKIYWDGYDQPPGKDGRVPLYIRSVKVSYHAVPSYAVSSHYDEDGCVYRAVRRHEVEHVEAFIRIFRESRDGLVEALEAIDAPTPADPVRVLPQEVDEAKKTIGAPFRAAVVAHSDATVAAMEADRRAKDAPEAYEKVYAECEPWQWMY